MRNPLGGHHGPRDLNGLVPRVSPGGGRGVPWERGARGGGGARPPPTPGGKTLSPARGVAGPDMYLVKLGGSVLTDKARLRTPRQTAIRRLARGLAAGKQPL